MTDDPLTIDFVLLDRRAGSVNSNFAFLRLSTHGGNVQQDHEARYKYAHGSLHLCLHHLTRYHGILPLKARERQAALDRCAMEARRRSRESRWHPHPRHINVGRFGVLVLSKAARNLSVDSRASPASWASSRAPKTSSAMRDESLGKLAERSRVL